MTTFILLGVLFVANFIVCSFVNILFRQTRKVDWGMSLVMSFIISLVTIGILGVGR